MSLHISEKRESNKVKRGMRYINDEPLRCKTPYQVVIDVTRFTHLHWEWMKGKRGDRRSYGYSVLLHFDSILRQRNSARGETRAPFLCFSGAFIAVCHGPRTDLIYPANESALYNSRKKVLSNGEIETLYECRGTKNLLQMVSSKFKNNTFSFPYIYAKEIKDQDDAV